MRAITADLKVIVGRLGPMVAKALEGAIKRAVTAQHAEVTSDHLLRALCDLPDSDLCVSMENAHLPRKEVIARLDWHLGRMHGKHEGKPRLSHALCLLLDDAGKLTTDRVRSGHVTSALLADPSLSPADIGKLLDGLPRMSLHLLASRVEDRGEVGRVAAPSAPADTPTPVEKPAPAAAAQTAPVPAVRTAEDTAPGPVEKAADDTAKMPAVHVAEEPPKAAASAPEAAKPSPSAAPAPEAKSPEPEPKSPGNVAEIRALVADRVVSEDARGITLSARVDEHDTTLRLEWDAAQRVMVLRIALPGSPPADPVRTAVALSTLNNALPHGAFIAEGERLGFRSHVFLDAEGKAPLEILLFAIRTCEEAAEAML